VKSSPRIVLAALAIALTRSAAARAQEADAPPVTAEAPAPADSPTADREPWNEGVAIEQRQAARDLFLEGNRLFRVPLFAQSARKYEAAIQAWKHPAFYFNLALAQLNLAQELEARDNLERALAYGEAPLGPEQFAEAQQQLRDVERQLGQIELRCETPGAEIALDGTLLFTGPGRQRVWVKAHGHEVAARKPNHLADSRRVVIAPGDVWSVELRLVTIDEAARTSRRWAAWKPWAVVGAGAAVVVASGAIHAASYSNFQAYDDEFTRLSCARAGCTAAEIGPALNDRLRRATREQHLAVTGYAIGGAALAAGVVLLYLNRSQLVEQSTSRRAPPSTSVSPSLSFDAAGNAVGVVVTVHR